MAEHSETIKKYPHKEDDVNHEKEIIDGIKKLPLEQRFQAIALNNYVLMRKQLDTEVEAQIQDIVKRYNKIQAPLMEELNKIISGERAPTEEEIKEATTQLTAEEVEKIKENLTSEPIEGYWFKVLTTCVRLSEDIAETDHELLKSIKTIEHIPDDDTDNFTIKFTFAPNDYFENEFLSVRFTMVEEGQPEKAEGTEIKWKEGKDITKKTITKTQKNKKTGKTRTVTKTVDAESFFNFFKSISGDDEEDADEEDEENEDAQRLEINYSIAATIQEEIVPFHLEYFLGLRLGDEEEYGCGPGCDDHHDHGDDGCDDEDDDEHDHKQCKPHKHKHAAPKAEGADGEKKQECKQQ